MYCPDCGKNGLGIWSSIFEVSCRHCGYKADLVSYLQRFDFEKIKFFSAYNRENNRDFVITDSNMQQLAKGTFFQRGAAIELRLESSASSKLGEAIKLLRVAFGEYGVVTVKQVGVDTKLKNCPLCEGSKWKRKENLVCSKCLDFQISIPDLVASLILNDHQAIYGIWPTGSLPENFVLYYKPLPHWVLQKEDFKEGDLVASIEVRYPDEVVIAIKPFSGSPEEILAIKKSLKRVLTISNFRVVILKK